MQQAAEPVVIDYVAVPHILVEANKIITLVADVFFVDETAFLLTEHVPVRTATSLSRHLKQVLEVYGCAGFVVRTILIDGEFEKIKPLMPSVECNTTSAKEHVSEAEQTIHTVKERTRGLLARRPFTHIPKRMKIKFVYCMILWMNTFPLKSGILERILPWKLLLQWRLDYKKHCRVPPGTYCEVHDEPMPTNTMAWWTHKGIVLGPTGNLQGSVKFYCINT